MVSEYDCQKELPLVPMFDPVEAAANYKMYSLDAQTYSYIVFILGVLGLVLYVFTSSLVLISLIGGRFYWFRKSDPSVLGDNLPGVSIVKPLMGIDPFLEVNLESHFTINYPKFELLFCVEDEEDEAIHLVNKLQERYPKVDMQLFIGGKEGIVNPMVSNMAPAYEAAKYDFVWINSSRVKVSSDIIMDMVCKLQKQNVAVVHQMPFHTDQRGFAASVEKIYFGGAFHRFYLAFSFLGLCCVTGMSYMLKKSLLDKIGGLSWYGKYLAEDFFLTKTLHEKGYKLVLSAFPAQQNVAVTSICGFNDRMVRWLRLRLNMLPIVSIVEPTMDVFPLGLYSSWCFYHFFGINPYIFFPAHVVMMLIIDYVLLCNAQRAPLLFSKAQFVISWLVREILATCIFFQAIVSPHKIVWGKKSFQSVDGWTHRFGGNHLRPIIMKGKS